MTGGAFLSGSGTIWLVLAKSIAAEDKGGDHITIKAFYFMDRGLCSGTLPVVKLNAEQEVSN